MEEQKTPDLIVSGEEHCSVPPRYVHVIQLNGDEPNEQYEKMMEMLKDGTIKVMFFDAVSPNGLQDALEKNGIQY